MIQLTLPHPYLSPYDAKKKQKKHKDGIVHVFDHFQRFTHDTETQKHRSWGDGRYRSV